MTNALSLISNMQWYAIQFLGDLAVWLIENPVVFIVVSLFVVVFIFRLVLRMVT